MKMNSFKDFGIEQEPSGFTGEKIKVERILNQLIVIKSFKIEKSKKKENTDYMTMQIEFKDEKRIVFTGAIGLMSTMKKVPKDKFPFEVTIVKPNEHFEFR